MADRLAGRVALITGAGGGQGRAAAVMFAREAMKQRFCESIARPAERRVEDLVLRGVSEPVAKSLRNLTDLLKYWRDDASHGVASRSPSLKLACTPKTPPK
jgi:NAD(P)-dependent dehydrogenase (short-subunit alcohol dehydrogenase family)